MAVKFGVIGLGGFGRVVCEGILKQSVSGEVPLKLATVYDPAPNHKALTKLHEAGIEFADSMDAMLSSDVDVVWLPLPIALHRPFTERVVGAGKAVMCEKPAAGTVEDVDAMKAAATRTGVPVAIGFQDMYEDSTWVLKRLLCDGAIGEVQSVVVTGSWPRSEDYYRRTDWAGRLKAGGTWVLDSPANNALSHFINLGLFWLGSTLESMADVVGVEGELFRAYPIENFDTCAFRARTRDGKVLLAYLTHVGREQEQPRIVVRGTRGRIVWRMGEGATVETPDGTRAIDVLRVAEWRQVVEFARYVASRGAEGRIFTPNKARVHTQLIWALSQSCEVQAFDDSLIRPYMGKGNARFLAVEGLNELFSACAARECLASESRLAPWAMSRNAVAI